MEQIPDEGFARRYAGTAAAEPPPMPAVTEPTSQAGWAWAIGVPAVLALVPLVASDPDAIPVWAMIAFMIGGWTVATRGSVGCAAAAAITGLECVVALNALTGAISCPPGGLCSDSLGAAFIVVVPPALLLAAGIGALLGTLLWKTRR